ncbi:MAG TPA: 3-isopropylmalate dehydratase small subunit [Acidimicrobiales bacterium]|jgi:3-isopropylmalate/(R)-2-methylmalate dehydratase small subunit
MEKTPKVTGRAVPLDRSDVDTDQIIPSDWLKRVERTGFGAGLFEEWRDDPDFVLNDPRFEGASILIAGPMFGTGSSREHAVWAIEDYGFRAVISPRFGDIFRNNCAKVGVVPAPVAPEVGETLLAAVQDDPTVEITVDVESRRVTCAAAGVDAPFEMDDFTRHRFLEGLDDIGLSLRWESELEAYESQRSADRPWLPTTAG